MANPKTAKPTGLKITRNYSTFTLSWKKGDKDYDDGQIVQYRTSLSPKKWISLSTGAKVTSRSVAIKGTAFYPNTKKYLTWVEMRVRGNRKKYKKKNKWLNPTISDWSVARFNIYLPKVPSLTVTKSEVYSNQCTFAWSCATTAADAYWYWNLEYQSRLVKESNVTDGSKLTWNNKQLGWQTGVVANNSSIAITEDSATIANGSYTRWFRIRSRGARGASAWTYVRHVYGLSYQAIINSAQAYQSSAGGFQCRVVWEAPSSVSHPIDKTTVEYCITVPDVDMTCPDGASWTSANVSVDTAGKDAASFPIDKLLAEDQCLFIRVNTEHDAVITYGTPVLVDGGVGMLKKPSTLHVVEGSDYRVTVTATNISDVEDSFLVVLYRPASDPVTEHVIGIIEHGETSGTFQAPDWSGETAHAFGVYAAVGDEDTITHDNALMKSEIFWGTGDVPKAPTEVSLSATSISGTIRVEWDWEWTEANGAEISWADHEDAWESTDEPETYEISNVQNARWNISGLETGIKWYVRVRLFKKATDENIYGAYSDIAGIDLASAPSIPTLVLSDSVITEDGSVTASWVYTTTDGTEQSYADICEAVFTPNGIQYGTYNLSKDTTVMEVDSEGNEHINSKEYYTKTGDYTYELVDQVTEQDNPVENEWYEYRATIAHTRTEQHVTIDAKQVGWETGEIYNLCVKVTSASGRVSDDWSAPVSIAIAEPLEINIVNTSLVEETETVIVDGQEETRTFWALESMPFTFELSEENATVLIARAGSYHMERPDETSFDGYDGETIALKTGVTEIDVEDLIGSLDDGASYSLIATVKDDLGQSAEASIDFEVKWSHQAVIPDGTVVIDTEQMIAEITPSASEDYRFYYELTTDETIVEGKTYYTRSGEGTEQSPYVYTEVAEPDVSEIATYYEKKSYGDVCDIYRLSVDRPELIVKNGEFGTTYVDPYMAIGQFGGYRLVFRTANNDYITEENQIAWLDLVDDTLETDYTIIDFDGGRILLQYNVDVSNTWNKDFQETKYLGGSVQGDWNKAVSRTSSVSAVTLTITDEETIEMIRRLAVSPSLCHVRTKDGSSYSADVQVSENYTHDKKWKIASYTFTITRVDTEGLDGMTLAEWNELHDEEE